MKEIQHYKYSLFRLENKINDNLTYSCFEYIDTFDSLAETKEVQEKEQLKTIIIPSY